MRVFQAKTKGLIARWTDAVSVKGSALIAVATLGFAGSAALAQDAPVFGQTWQYFLDRCGLAYTDPQRYVNDIAAGLAPSPGNLSVTSDGKILWAGTTGANLHDTYTVSVVGNRRVQNCYAMGWFDGHPSTSAEINADFLAYAGSRPDLVVSGGLTEEGAGLNGFTSETYRYVVLGALPDQIVVRVYIGLWVVEIFSTHIDGGQ